jgi:hypothetical protein
MSNFVGGRPRRCYAKTLGSGLSLCCTARRGKQCSLAAVVRCPLGRGQVLGLNLRGTHLGS